MRNARLNESQAGIKIAERYTDTQRCSDTQQVEGFSPRGCTSYLPLPLAHSPEDFRVWLTVFVPTPSADLHTHTGDAPLHVSTEVILYSLCRPGILPTSTPYLSCSLLLKT